MSVLTYKQRKKLHKATFALPDEKKYPINDISHAKNALARASGKPEESKVKTAVYRKYPSLNPKNKKGVSMATYMSDIIINGIELSDGHAKAYKVLSVGIMHSKKYHGKWDVNDYSCEQGAGTIEIAKNFLEAIFNNFKANKNETQPFIDIGHDATSNPGAISLGEIAGMELIGDDLFIKPVWNTK